MGDELLTLLQNNNIVHVFIPDVQIILSVMIVQWPMTCAHVRIHVLVPKVIVLLKMELLAASVRQVSIFRDHLKPVILRLSVMSVCVNSRTKFMFVASLAYSQ